MDKPTRELLKPDVAALDVPDDARLTLDASRAKNRAGESTGYLPDATFYKVGPLTVKADPPKTFIGNRGSIKEGFFWAKPLPGARRQLIDPDNIEEGYDEQPEEF